MSFQFKVKSIQFAVKIVYNLQDDVHSKKLALVHK